MTSSMKGRVAVITGGAGMIGHAAAMSLAAAGANVMLVDINAEALAVRRGAIEALGVAVDSEAPREQRAREAAEIVKNASRVYRWVGIYDVGDDEIASVSDHVFEVPKVDELLSPIVNVIPLQLLAYHIADIEGKDVDQPRNLAKTVTVE